MLSARPATVPAGSLQGRRRQGCFEFTPYAAARGRLSTTPRWRANSALSKPSSRARPPRVLRRLLPAARGRGRHLVRQGQKGARARRASARASSCEALFEHRHPETGEKLGQAPRENSIRAYDLTFSAPKSVSVLATLIGGEVEQKLVAAHDNAVKAVIDAIEERTTTRAGKDGVIRLDTSGLSRADGPPPHEPTARPAATHPRAR